MVADMFIVWFVVCVFCLNSWAFGQCACSDGLFGWLLTCYGCVCLCFLDFSRCLGTVALTEVVFDFSSGTCLLTCLVLLLFEF